jgi:hypothetical protein
MPRTPIRQDDELPTLDLTALAHVTGGTGSSSDMSSMMMPMMMMMMRGQQQQAAPAAAAAAAAPTTPPWTPQVMVDGVAQQLTSAGNGNFTVPDINA